MNPTWLKAIDQASKVRLGFNHPVKMGDWVVGGAFAVLCPEYVEQPQAGIWVHKPKPVLQAMLKAYLEDGQGLPEAEVAAKPHEGTGPKGGKAKCVSRRVNDDLEVAFSLVNVGKYAGVKTWHIGPGGLVLYGYDSSGAIVAVAAARPYCGGGPDADNA